MNRSFAIGISIVLIICAILLFVFSTGDGMIFGGIMCVLVAIVTTMVVPGDDHYIDDYDD